MTATLAAALLGAASGLRSMAGPAQLSRRLAARADRGAGGAGAELLSRPALHLLLQLGAVGEMVVDKLPIVPDRTEPGPLGGRALLGGAAAWVLNAVSGQSRARGAAVGAAAAIAGAFAGYHARRLLVRRVGAPDPAVALCEDVLAIGLARLATRRIAD